MREDISLLLPAPVPHFQGRRGALKKLREALTAHGGAALVPARGASMGTSALLAQYLSEEAGRYAVVLYASLDVVDGRPGPILRRWAEMLEVEGDDDETLIAGIRGALAAASPSLVVLDDVRAGWEGAAARLASARPESAHLLIAGDPAAAGALAVPALAIGPLPPLEAIPMLRAMGLHRLAQDAAVQLIQAVEGHPLALDWSARRMLTEGSVRPPDPAAIPSEVEEFSSVIADFPAGRSAGVAGLALYGGLSELGQRVFRWMSAFAPGAVALDALAAVLLVDEETVRAALDELTARGLAVALPWPPNSWLLAAPARRLARGIAEAAHDANDALERHLSWHVDLATRRANASLLAKILPDLAIAAQTARRWEDDDSAIAIAQAVAAAGLNGHDGLVATLLRAGADAADAQGDDDRAARWRDLAEGDPAAAATVVPVTRAAPAVVLAEATPRTAAKPAPAPTPAPETVVDLFGDRLDDGFVDLFAEPEPAPAPTRASAAAARKPPAAQASQSGPSAEERKAASRVAEAAAKRAERAKARTGNWVDEAIERCLGRKDAALLQARDALTRAGDATVEAADEASNCLDNIDAARDAAALEAATRRAEQAADQAGAAAARAETAWKQFCQLLEADAAKHDADAGDRLAARRIADEIQGRVREANAAAKGAFEATAKDAGAAEAIRDAKDLLAQASAAAERALVDAVDALTGAEARRFATEAESAVDAHLKAFEARRAELTARAASAAAAKDAELGALRARALERLNALSTEALDAPTPEEGDDDEALAAIQAVSAARDRWVEGIDGATEAWRLVTRATSTKAARVGAAGAEQLDAELPELRAAFEAALQTIAGVRQQAAERAFVREQRALISRLEASLQALASALAAATVDDHALDHAPAPTAARARLDAARGAAPPADAIEAAIDEVRACEATAGVEALSPLSERAAASDRAIEAFRASIDEALADLAEARLQAQDEADALNAELAHDLAELDAANAEMAEIAEARHALVDGSAPWLTAEALSTLFNEESAWETSAAALAAARAGLTAAAARGLPADAEAPRAGAAAAVAEARAAAVESRARVDEARSDATAREAAALTRRAALDALDAQVRRDTSELLQAIEHAREALTHPAADEALTIAERAGSDVLAHADAVQAAARAGGEQTDLTSLDVTVARAESAGAAAAAATVTARDALAAAEAAHGAATLQERAAAAAEAREQRRNHLAQRYAALTGEVAATDADAIELAVDARDAAQLEILAADEAVGPALAHLDARRAALPAAPASEAELADALAAFDAADTDAELALSDLADARARLVALIAADAADVAARLAVASDAARGAVASARAALSRAADSLEALDETRARLAPHAKDLEAGALPSADAAREAALPTLSALQDQASELENDARAVDATTRASDATPLAADIVARGAAISDGAAALQSALDAAIHDAESVAQARLAARRDAATSRVVLALAQAADRAAAAEPAIAEGAAYQESDLDAAIAQLRAAMSEFDAELREARSGLAWLDAHAAPEQPSAWLEEAGRTADDTTAALDRADAAAGGCLDVTLALAASIDAHLRARRGAARDEALGQLPAIDLDTPGSVVDDPEVEAAISRLAAAVDGAAAAILEAEAAADAILEAPNLAALADAVAEADAGRERASLAEAALAEAREALHIAEQGARERQVAAANTEIGEALRGLLDRRAGRVLKFPLADHADPRLSAADDPVLLAELDALEAHERALDAVEADLTSLSGDAPQAPGADDDAVARARALSEAARHKLEDALRADDAALGRRDLAQARAAAISELGRRFDTIDPGESTDDADAGLAEILLARQALDRDVLDAWARLARQEADQGAAALATVDTEAAALAVRPDDTHVPRPTAAFEAADHALTAGRAAAEAAIDAAEQIRSSGELQEAQRRLDEARVANNALHSAIAHASAAVQALSAAVLTAELTAVRLAGYRRDAEAFGALGGVTSALLDGREADRTDVARLPELLARVNAATDVPSAESALAELARAASASVSRASAVVASAECRAALNAWTSTGGILPRPGEEEAASAAARWTHGAWRLSEAVTACDQAEAFAAPWLELAPPESRDLLSAPLARVRQASGSAAPGSQDAPRDLELRAAFVENEVSSLDSFYRNLPDAARAASASRAEADRVATAAQRERAGQAAESQAEALDALLARCEAWPDLPGDVSETLSSLRDGVAASRVALAEMDALPSISEPTAWRETSERLALTAAVADETDARLAVAIALSAAATARLAEDLATRRAEAAAAISIQIAAMVALSERVAERQQAVEATVGERGAGNDPATLEAAAPLEAHRAAIEAAHQAATKAAAALDEATEPLALSARIAEVAALHDAATASDASHLADADATTAAATAFAAERRERNVAAASESADAVSAIQMDLEARARAAFSEIGATGASTEADPEVGAARARLASRLTDAATLAGAALEASVNALDTAPLDGAGAAAIAERAAEIVAEAERLVIRFDAELLALHESIDRVVEGAFEHGAEHVAKVARDAEAHDRAVSERVRAAREAAAPYMAEAGFDTSIAGPLARIEALARAVGGHTSDATHAEISARNTASLARILAAQADGRAAMAGIEAAVAAIGPEEEALFAAIEVAFANHAAARQGDLDALSEEAERLRAVAMIEERAAQDEAAGFDLDDVRAAVAAIAAAARDAAWAATGARAAAEGARFATTRRDLASAHEATTQAVSGSREAWARCIDARRELSALLRDREFDQISAWRERARALEADQEEAIVRVHLMADIALDRMRGLTRPAADGAIDELARRIAAVVEDAEAERSVVRGAIARAMSGSRPVDLADAVHTGRHAVVRTLAREGEIAGWDDEIDEAIAAERALRADLSPRWQAAADLGDVADAVLARADAAIHAGAPLHELDPDLDADLTEAWLATVAAGEAVRAEHLSIVDAIGDAISSFDPEGVSAQTLTLQARLTQLETETAELEEAVPELLRIATERDAERHRFERAISRTRAAVGVALVTLGLASAARDRSRAHASSHGDASSTQTETLVALMSAEARATAASVALAALESALEEDANFGATGGEGEDDAVGRADAATADAEAAADLARYALARVGKGYADAASAPRASRPNTGRAGSAMRDGQASAARIAARTAKARSWLHGREPDPESADGSSTITEAIEGILRVDAEAAHATGLLREAHRRVFAGRTEEEMVVAALAHQLSAFDRLSERALERLGAAWVADHDQRVAANATIERRHAEMRDARQAIATFDAQPSSERRVMLFERGVNLARATKDRQSELDWLVELGEAASRIRPALAIESLEDALILAEDLGDERMQRDIVGRLASARRRTGDTQEARTWYERAIALARASGDGVTEARWTLELGELLTTSGRLDAGEDRIEAAAALARDLSDRALTHRAMAAQARLAELRAEIPTARRHLEDALRGATDDADGELAALLHLRLAWLDRQVGAASNAWHHATQAGLGRSQEIRAAAAIEAAKSLALAGLAPRATAGLTPWLDVARDLGDRRLEAQIHMALAWVWSRNEPRTVAADDLFAASELQATILELDDALVNVVPIALGEVDEEGHRRARVESHLRAALDVEPDAPPETLEARQLALADVLQTHAEAP